jgi:hypothetical protein
VLFFKRILKIPVSEITRKERRNDRRVPIGPEFPMKAVLVFAGRGGTVTPMSTPGGWDWPGKLLDCSADGARIRLPAAALAVRGDFCDLDLRIDGSRLFVPCEITNVRVEIDGAHFGLRHCPTDETTRAAYLQFVAIIAMGATLKPAGKAKADGSGYLVESYTGTGSKLTVWRDKTGAKTAAAAEFTMQDCAVRLAKGRTVEYLADNRVATPAKVAEIVRLLSWVTSNLTDAVPADVRSLLRRAAE